MTFEDVRELIHEQNGRRLWEAETAHKPPQRIVAYYVNGRVLLLHDMSEDGWDIYRASDTNRIDETLVAAGLQVPEAGS